MASQGMFGPSGAEVELALREQQKQEAMQMGQQSASQAIGSAMASAGQSFGRAIEKAGGYEDPRIAKAKLLEEAKMEVDSSGADLMSDPKGYYGAAFKALQSRGLTDEAMGVRQLMMKEEAQEAETQGKLATAQAAQFKNMKGRFTQNAKGKVIDSWTGQVVEEGASNYEAASTAAKIHQDFVNGAFGDPESPEAQSLYDDAMSKANYKRPANNVSVTTVGENEYNKNIGKLASASDMSKLSAADQSQEFLDSADRITSALENSDVIIGPGADVRLGLAKVMNILGADNDDTISQTQALLSSLAETTLDSIPSSNLGGGQGFTERDKEFLIAAKAGNINWTREALEYLAYTNKRAARYKVEVRNKLLERKTPRQLEALASAGVDITPLPLPEIGSPPKWNKNAKPSKAPAPAKATDAPAGMDPDMWSELSPRGKELYLKRNKGPQ